MTEILCAKEKFIHELNVPCYFPFHNELCLIHQSSDDCFRDILDFTQKWVYQFICLDQLIHEHTYEYYVLFIYNG